MSELQSSERQQLRVLSELSYCNPFEPVRIGLEQKLLGDAYEAESLHAWSRTDATSGYERRNVVTINDRAMALAEQLLGRQKQRGPLRGDDADLCDDLLTYTLYYRHIAVVSPPQLQPQASDQIAATTCGKNMIALRAGGTRCAGCLSVMQVEAVIRDTR